LSQHFGKAGEYYYRIVRGQDDRPVNPNRARKSYGAETTFETDLLDTGIMLEHLIGLTERVLAKMRARKECGCTLTLKVKYADFEQVTRSRTLAFPFLQTADVAPHLIALLRRTEAGDRKVRLWGSVFRRWAACLSGRGGSWICLIPVWNSEGSLAFGQVHAFNPDLLALFTFHEGTRSSHRIFVATGDIDLLDGQLQLFFLNLLLLSLIGGRGSAPGQSDQDGR
jgi:hypothetical protein